MSKYSGSVRMSDGTRRQLTSDAAKAICESADAAETARAIDMPTEQDAIFVMFNAWLRLKDLGWREAEYCPKDGSPFNVIEPGSTGIHRARYSGEWPKGMWWLEDFGDLWPSRPILFKLDPDAEAAYAAKIKAAVERFRREQTSENVGDERPANTHE